MDGALSLAERTPKSPTRKVACFSGHWAVATAAVESGDSVITSTVVPAPTTKVKPKTTRTKSLFMAVIPFLHVPMVQRLQPG